MNGRPQIYTDEYLDENLNEFIKNILTGQSVTLNWKRKQECRSISGNIEKLILSGVITKTGITKHPNHQCDLFFLQQRMSWQNTVINHNC